MSESYRIRMKTCPRCDGTGEVRSGVGIASAVCSLGVTSLFGIDDTEECPVCDGEGQIMTEVEVRT